ncbi:hypothetical protein ACQ4PT_051419 [Festuca glaucescens]
MAAAALLGRRSAAMAAAVLATVAALLAPAAVAQLSTSFYSGSCASLESIVRSGMVSAVQQEPRMGASILRLFFHDCFVNGCDGSVLLDDSSTLTGEKNAGPNANSLRGYEVIDAIKSPGRRRLPRHRLLRRHPSRRRPRRRQPAGRSDVGGAAGPSGRAHDHAGGGEQQPPLAVVQRGDAYLGVRVQGPRLPRHGGAVGRAHHRGRASGATDGNLAPLDAFSSVRFDNGYYRNLLSRFGLLHSDQELFGSGGPVDSIAQTYAGNGGAFSADFVTAMIKMGNISPLTGSSGEIRNNCRKPN